jgi:FkbM family methyltransferase
MPDNMQLIFTKYLGDLSVAVDTTYAIEREMLSGKYDIHSSRIIDKFIKKGDYCLDIGANIGALSLVMAKKVGATGKVFCFEPGPMTFERLQKNLSLNNGFSKILVLEKSGLSDKPGSLFWHHHEENPGDANLSELLEGSGVEVPVITVDSYCEARGVSKLNFVKIDVESMEYEVIKGGMKTWEKHLPILYYETLKEFEAYRKEPVFKYIENMLGGLGYTFYKLENDISITQTKYPDLSNNTLALPPIVKSGG